MTDVNGMTFANLSLSSNICAAGETLTAGIAVKNGSGVNIPVFNLRMVCSKADFTGNEGDRAITFGVFGFATNDILPKGKTVVYTQTFPIGSKAAEYFALYPAVRAVPVYIEYEAYNTAIGNFGRSDYKIDDLVLINARHQPRIEEFEVQRCNSGLPDDEGEEALLSARIAMGNRSGSGFMSLRLHYAENGDADKNSPYIDLTAQMPAFFSGISNGADLIGERFSNGSNWDFMLLFGDEYESVTAKQSLARAFANLHLSGAKTGGACFGGFSASENGDPRLESHYPAYFYAGIHGVSIFSSEEVRTGGYWVDNKPLYTRVIAIKGAASGVVQNVDMPADVETIWIDAAASFCVHSNGTVYPVCYTATNGSSVFVANCSLTNQKIYAATYLGTTADFYIKIFYTRKTDEAIAPVQTHLAFADSSGSLLQDANGCGFMTEVY